MSLEFRKLRDTFLKKHIGGHRLIRRSVLSREAENRLKALLVEDVYGKLFSIDPDDNIVSRAMLLKGDWQYPELVFAVETFSNKKTTTANKVYIDIGAHVGTQLVTAAHKGEFKKLYGFEVTPNTFQHLKRNVMLNDLQDKIEVFQKAIGPNTEDYYLEEVYQNKGANYLTQTPSEGKKSIKISTVNLVEFSREQNLDLFNEGLSHFFWIDTEGFEVSILNSLLPQLNSDRDAVVFELNLESYDKMEALKTFEALFQKFSNCISVRTKKRYSKPIDLLKISDQDDIMFY